MEFVSYGQKSFITLGPVGFNQKKANPGASQSCFNTTLGTSKIECLLLSSHFHPSLMFTSKARTIAPVVGWQILDQGIS